MPNVTIRTLRPLAQWSPTLALIVVGYRLRRRSGDLATATDAADTTT